MGVPGWSFGHDLGLAWTYLGPILAAPLVIGIFVPFYSGLRLYTAYEYLERRFDVSVRLVVSGLFQFLRVIHVAIAIYAPSLALSLVTGLPVWQCVFVIGVLTTIYTSFGGVKAVIWTDVIQFATIWVGVGLILVSALSRIDGGLGAVYRMAHEAGRLKFWNPSLNPAEATALWPCLIGGMTLNLATLTTDQALIQRLFTTRSQRDARRSILVNGFLQAPLLLLLSGVGIVLFAFYRQHPGQLAGLSTADAIVPFFAMEHLPRAVPALVVAAIFAASMAVMSAGINSLSTATTVDFYQRLLRPDAAPEHLARFGRAATAFWGVTGTLLALFMGHLGSIVLAYSRVNSVVAGPMLGIFLLGMLTRRATACGVLVGAAAGSLAVAVVAALTGVSFFYYSVVGVAVTLAAGWVASLFTSRVEPAKLEGLVLRGRMTEGGIRV